jgi:N-acyl-D-amino-acid deacylase
LVDIAKLRGETPAEAFSKLAQLSIGYEVETGQPGDMIIGTSMNEQDLQALMVWPHANICTDGGLQDRHPRGAGSFPRVLGRYVRDLQLMRLEEGIHKMTGLPARHLGFTNRGLIKPGYQADLVLLDPKTVVDRATSAAPSLSSRGISDVWVNGEAVLRKGGLVGVYPGQVLRRVTAP